MASFQSQPPDLNPENEIFSTRSDMPADFRAYMGLLLDDERDENLPINCVGMDTLFGVKSEHYESFPQDLIGQKAPDDAAEDVVRHLVEKMTGIDVKDIDTILETKVPKTINESVSEIIDLLEPLFTKAWEMAVRPPAEAPVGEKARQSSRPYEGNQQDDYRSRHVMPVAFYEALRKILKKRSLLYTPGPVLCTLLDICNTSVSTTAISGQEYHDLWKGLIRKVLLTLVPRCGSKQDIKRRVELRESGTGRVGFKVYQGQYNLRPHFPVIQSNPDVLLCMHSILDLPNGMQCLLDTAVLAVEVETSYAETASYIPGETRASSSSLHSSVSPDACNLVTEAYLTKISPTPQENERIAARSASVCSKSLSQDIMLNDADMECGDDNCEEHAGVPLLVRQLMSRIKKQHAVQLIGMLKWSTGVINYANLKIKQVKGLENYQLKDKHIGSLGLFMVQNRVYFTRLSIMNTSDGVTNHRNVVTSWALDPYAMRYPSTYGCTPKMKISDVYLDIFNPRHLKALLTFLRVAFWGEFQVYS